MCHGILPKVVSALFTTLNRGGGGGEETKFVLSMFNNFVILAGMDSRVLSKIVRNTLNLVVRDNSIFFKGAVSPSAHFSAHSKLEKVQPYFFKFMIQDGCHLRVSALQERHKFRQIDVNTRLTKLSKYWIRQHKAYTDS